MRPWLRSLNLEMLAVNFEAKQYTDLAMIVQGGGLTDEDLDYIGVTVPIHRRVLKQALAPDGSVP